MSNDDLSIAIIGISGEFPGAKNINEFWQNLVNGKESLLTLSSAELDAAGIPESEYSKKNYIPRAGTLDDIEYFAATFFGYSPREASLIDPQQRKILEHAWHAFEDAAVNPFLSEAIIGIFAGSSLNTYLLNNILSHPHIQESDEIQQILFGNGQDYLATRIAYQLNCKGPAINIQTACSTSLVAIHEACQHLLTYQVDIALAGGVSINVPQAKGYLYSVDGMLSADGHCRPFSEKASGTIFSSGLGLVVLKRLEDALKDGNPIYAVVKGSAVNNDGNLKVGYTAPSIEGQSDVIALAQATANVTPEQINYVETHGTATQLGDPIELVALQKVFAESAQDPGSCAIGSLKSNIGHLDVAAGVAGFIKTALSLYHGKIPPTLHHEQPSLKFNWENSPFYVNTELKDLTKSSVAAVSSFGIGGTNAHAILGQFEESEKSGSCSQPALFIFSAKTEKALQNKLEQFVNTAKDFSHLSLHSIARTLQQGRVAFRYRTTICAESIEELVIAINKKSYTITSCEAELAQITIKPIEHCNQSDLNEIASQWLLGHKIDWQTHYALLQPRMVHLPLYPFERARYWIDRYQSTNHDRQEMMPIEDWFYQPSWKPSILSCLPESTENKKVLLIIDRKFSSILNKDTLEKMGSVIIAYAGDSFNLIDETTYEFNIASAQDYIDLLLALHRNNMTPNYVVHALSLTTSINESTRDIFDIHQTSGLLSAIYFIQAWEKIFIDSSLKLTVITNRLNRIAEAQHEPHKAPILAAVKVIPKEYPFVEAQLIDIDCVDHPQYKNQQVRLMLQEITKPCYDQEEIVFRGIQRWLRTYVKTQIIEAATKHEFSQSPKVILITGGLGQLGLDIADYFAQFPQSKIALIARTRIPDKTEWAREASQHEVDHPLRIMLERMIKMQERGCVVNAFSADVSDKVSMEKVVKEIESTWGSITGVIHAAGETVNGIISMKTEDSLIKSYQAKVYGSYHLCEIFAEKTLDFMILCSSMNAVIGGLGQLDNTAANTLIDYLAEYHAAQTGKPIFAINWGAINTDRPLKVNVVPQFADLSAEHKRNKMSDDEVDAVYTRILTHHLGPRIVISTIDMNDVLLNWNHVASIKDLAKDREHIVQNQRNLSNEDRPNTSVEKWMADIWQRLLGIEGIGKQDNFFNLGGHSLAAVQFMTKVQDNYQLKVHVMNLYELPTLTEFASYMEKLMKQKTKFKTELTN